jgi:hypothetical protein
MGIAFGTAVSGDVSCLPGDYPVIFARDQASENTDAKGGRKHAKEEPDPDLPLFFIGSAGFAGRSISRLHRSPEFRYVRPAGG